MKVVSSLQLTFSVLTYHHNFTFDFFLSNGLHMFVSKSLRVLTHTVLPSHHAVVVVSSHHIMMMTVKPHCCLHSKTLFVIENGKVLDELFLSLEKITLERAVKLVEGRETMAGLWLSFSFHSDWLGLNWISLCMWEWI